MSDLTDNWFYSSAELIWLCIRLNDAKKYCNITLKIMIMLQNVCENCVWILEEEKQPSAPYVLYLMKKVKETGILIDKPKHWKSHKQCVPAIKLLLWQKVCAKRHQHLFTVVLNNCTFRRYDWDEFCIKTLVWRHTKFNWFQCAFASLSGPPIDLQKMPILAKKNHLFRWSSFWSWRVCIKVAVV